MHKTWLALFAGVTIGLIAFQWSGDDGPAGPPDNTGIRTWGRVVVGVRELEKVAGNEGKAEQLVSEIKDAELVEADRVRRAIVEAEVRGPEPALRLLENTKADDEQRALLQERYRGGELGTEARESLVADYGWFGRLSNVYGRPDDDPERRALLDAARTAAIVFLLFSLAAIPAVVGGLVLLLVFLVKLSTRRIRMRFEAGDGDALPWLQTVVVALALLAALMLDLFDRLGVPALLQPWLVLPAVLWPVLRGVRWGEWARGLGLVRGSGLLREMGAGFLGYLGGLPLVLVGLWLTAHLSEVTGLKPDHPIKDVFSRSVPAWILFLQAVAWPAIVEELIFRGAFYRYLRPAVSAVAAALVSGLVFAALHPQGFAGVPVLLSIAFVIAVLREWRGSIVASMTAHAVHNGWLLVLGVTVVG